MQLQKLYHLIIKETLIKFTDRDGTFLEDEKVTYAVGQSFKILKFDPYDARGKFVGEGIINDNFFGEKVISQTKHQIFKMANFIKHILTLSKLVNQLTNTDQ